MKNAVRSSLIAVVALAGSFHIFCAESSAQPMATLETYFRAVDGDFNNDGAYDDEDINMLTAETAAGTNKPALDLTLDGVVNMHDIESWLTEASVYNLPPGSSYLVGDANLDGVVDDSDFDNWSSSRFTVNSKWTDGNFNGDSVIDVRDYMGWNRSKSTPPTRGMPGDGIPDLYYFESAGTAPNGESRSAGTLLLDTDGNDFQAVIVSSPTDFASAGTCVLCDNGFLTLDQYVAGYSADSSQWARSLPLTGNAPVGVFDLAQLAGGGAVDFPSDAVIFETDTLGGFVFNVTIVPEPSSLLLLGLSTLMLIRRRRAA